MTEEMNLMQSLDEVDYHTRCVFREFTKSVQTDFSWSELDCYSDVDSDIL